MKVALWAAMLLADFPAFMNTRADLQDGRSYLWGLCRAEEIFVSESNEFLASLALLETESGGLGLPEVDLCLKPAQVPWSRAQ